MGAGKRFTPVAASANLRSGWEVQERMLRPGDPLPELSLVSPQDRRIPLRALLGEATALIFLRHLG